VFTTLFGRAELRGGEIRLDGEPVGGLAPRALLARGVACAPHHAIALEGGRAVLEAPADAILAHPRIRTVFLGGHVAGAVSGRPPGGA